MGDREDPNRRRPSHVEESVRKAVHPDTPHGAACSRACDDGSGARGDLDQALGGTHNGEVSLAQPLAASLVPKRGLLQFDPRPVNVANGHQRLARSFRRIAAWTFSAGTPTTSPLTTPSARCTASARHACAAFFGETSSPG